MQEGITKLWMSVTPEICCRYIDNLQKLISKVVQVDGAACGY